MEVLPQRLGFLFVKVYAERQVTTRNASKVGLDPSCLSRHPLDPLSNISATFGTNLPYMDCLMPLKLASPSVKEATSAFLIVKVIRHCQKRYFERKSGNLLISTISSTC